ncbi:hypothetical protein ACFWZ4_14365 [Frateuria sp. GZRe12]|uniref:hypothetical protein n=1 Tax=Frateuria sp. GZRe12 TaxID=3351533 RepID=UPI003EDBFB8C
MKMQLAIGLFLSCLTFGSHPQSLEQLDQRAHADKAIDLLNQLQAQVDEQAHAMKYECLKAFGNSAFCGCLSSNLPVAFSFADYIAIVTKSKEANGYAKLTPDTKKAYDTVPSVREKCVAQARSAP